MSKILCLGELLVDFVPTENGFKLQDVDQFKKMAGGAPANVSAAIATLGGRSSMIGKIGADPFGDFLVETLRDKGVEVECLIQTKEAKTALAFVSLQNNGERDFMFYREPSADMLLEQKDLKAEWFEEAEVYHFGSISLIDHPVREATMEGIKLATEHNMVISFDPNIRLSLWKSEEDAREQILQSIPAAHMVKISEEELSFLTGINEEQEAVSTLMSGLVQLIIVTKGKEGCSYYTKGSSGSVKGITVKPIDATGAGDAFVGGFLYQVSQEINQIDDLHELLNDQKKLEEILAFANVCGALTTTKRGAISALPTLDEVQSYFIKE
ncbi:PfkB family carbohydrate kinase [Halalkalibacter alkalisediminis]|uniref:PfkB family carbohydrate kinase n=1 Tax=Halalkalibacter alkalisediminis TaxID=935616 RepID=A0ABV6NEM1_9BACI|nr:PfkB family carbohydrate kinase [Halalkalibacter alkalisediminis]